MKTKFVPNALSDFDADPESVFPHHLSETPEGRARIAALVSAVCQDELGYTQALVSANLHDLEWFTEEGTGRIAVVGESGTALEELPASPPRTFEDTLSDLVSSLRSALEIARCKGRAEEKDRIIKLVGGSPPEAKPPRDVIERGAWDLTTPAIPKAFTRVTFDSAPDALEIVHDEGPEPEPSEEPGPLVKEAYKIDPSFEAVEVSFNGKVIEGARIEEVGADGLLSMYIPPEVAARLTLSRACGVGFDIVAGDTWKATSVDFIEARTAPSFGPLEVEPLIGGEATEGEAEKVLEFPRMPRGPLQGHDMSEVKMTLLSEAPAKSAYYKVVDKEPSLDVEGPTDEQLAEALIRAGGRTERLLCLCGVAHNLTIEAGQTLTVSATRAGWIFLNGWKCSMCVKRRGYKLPHGIPALVCSCGASIEHVYVEGLQDYAMTHGWQYDGAYHCKECLPPEDHAKA